ncbi:MAG: hypothetical protein SWK90_06805 [Chloroflexota bacterium]|nr:hypothetical protein [Chloroflexota bacterium]
MKRSLGLTGMKRSRKVTLVLVTLCCVSLIVAFLIGISDNPPGLVLCYIAVTALILAFVHTWRQVKRFLILLGASLIGFPLFVILHNLFYALGQVAADVIVLGTLLEFLHVVFFLVAIMVCPPGVLIGAVGSVVTYCRGRQVSDETP